MKKVLFLVSLLLISVSASAARNYGALAYNSRTGAYGYSYDYSTQGAANRRALRECGRGCRVVVRFWGGCAAYATGKRAYGWGTAGTRSAAKNRALRECRTRTYGCRVRVWACNSRR